MSDKFRPIIGRRSFVTGAVIAAAASALPSFADDKPARSPKEKYADPKNPALPKSSMKLDIAHAALVVIDPQIDFISDKGKAWAVVGESVTEQNLVPNLLLFCSKRRKQRISPWPSHRTITIPMITNGKFRARRNNSSTI